jgi:hypothetical protein
MQNNDGVINDEITLKELLLGAKYYFFFLLSKFWIILIGGLMFSAIFFYQAYVEVETYVAELTYTVNEEKGNSAGGVGAILGQFGLGGASGSEHNLDKIIAFGRSRRIVQQVLLDSVKLQGVDDLIANHIINIYDYHDYWREKGEVSLAEFYFTDENIDNFSREEVQVLKHLYKFVIGTSQAKITGITKLDKSEQTGVLSIVTTSKNEELSLYVTSKLYDKLSAFYINQSVEKQLVNHEIISNKSDSVANALSSAEYRLAKSKDRSGNLFQNSDRLMQARLLREVQTLSLLYGELLKNKETAAFVLQTTTPFFQLVDQPLLPLDKSRKSYIKQIVFGGSLGVVLMILGLILWKIGKEALEEN